MELCHTKTFGNIKVEGIYRSDSLEIVSPNVCNNNELPGSKYRLKAADESEFEAKEVHVFTLKIAKGATLKTEFLSANNVEVHGTLAADRIVVSNILEVFPGATLNGDVTACALRVHPGATLLGKAKERVEDNVTLAKIHLKHPDCFSDFRWLESSLELIGWECIARSSSGNGCNYSLRTPSKKVFRTMYVPLRKDIWDFIPTLTRTLRVIAGEPEL